MKSFKHFYIYCSLLSLFSCNIKNDSKLANDKTSPNSLFDTSVIALFERDNTTYLIPIDPTKTNLTKSDFVIIDSILNEVIRIRNIEQSQSPKGRLINLNEYKRQYGLTINEKNEKEVWVNCFCNNSRDWKTRLIIVDDGGSCFFDITINLSTKLYTQFFVHN